MARKFEHSHIRDNDNGGKKLVEHGIQTDIEPPKPLTTKNKVGRPRKVCETTDILDFIK